MSSYLLIQATDLQAKSEFLRTRAILPLLLRKLVQRTDLTAVAEFRTEEGTQLPGWDGLITEAAGSRYVPAGPSAWELGVDRAIKGKADSEYEKRTADPLGIDPSQTTFVFVTPRRWGAKHKWVAEKQAKGRWKDVRAYDADDLLGWLEYAPAVHIWLSIELGKYPEGTSDLQSWWEDWAAATEPILTPDIVLAGRESTIQIISDWLVSTKQTFALQGGTRAESIAAFASAVLENNELRSYLDKTVVIQTEAAWQTISAREEGLLLIPEFDSSKLLGTALRHKHRVFLPLDAATTPIEDVIILPPNDWKAMQSALAARGIAQPGADDLAHLARRSFNAFRRKWLISRVADQLPWAHSTVGNSLLPALLLGSWEDNHSGDIAVVMELAGQEYDRYRQTLLGWALAPDAPVREVAATWFVVDKADAWEQLRRQISPTILIRYKQVVLEVLGTPDPKYALPGDEQKWARIRGVERVHSTRLRNGIADTLALIGSGEDDMQPAVRANNMVNEVLGALLREANEDQSGRIWISFGRDIQLLAEASPELFLTYVLEDLDRLQPVLLILFEEKEGLLFRASEHSGLLWALEGLAWNPTYLFKTALVLAKLDRLDPGGQLSNRPANSLRHIFLLWNPQTMADLPVRMSVLNRLRQVEPDATWRLLIKLLPKSNDVSFPSATPKWRWRNWQIRRTTSINRQEWQDSIDIVTGFILEEVASDHKRWVDLFPNLGEWLLFVSLQKRDEILSKIESLSMANMPDDEQVMLRDALGNLLSIHRSVKSDRALPKSVLDRLSIVYESVAPKSLASRYAWLFAAWPKLPVGFKRNYEERETEVREAQDIAFQSIVEEAGIEGVISLIAVVPESYQLGWALGRSKWATVYGEKLLKQYLASAQKEFGQFAEGLLTAFFSKTSKADKLNFILSRVAEWSSIQVAYYLARLDKTAEVWQLVEELGTSIEDEYWKYVMPYGIEDEYATQAVANFMHYGRYASAIEVIYHQSIKASGRRKPVASSLMLIESLEKLAKVGAENDAAGMVSNYILEDLIESLASETTVPRERLVQLAFTYQPVFGSFENPQILENELAQNPSFFVELLKLTFRSKNTDATEQVEEILPESSVTLRAWKVLHEWKTVPGSRKGADINGAELMAWIMQARNLAQECARLEICDSLIGGMLSHASQKSDETAWPPVAVKDAIEAVHTPDLLDGIKTGRFNIHGRTHAVTGGKRELDIAADYKRWARFYSDAHYTSELLYSLAKRYEQMAHSEQEDANLRDQTD